MVLRRLYNLEVVVFCCDEVARGRRADTRSRRLLLTLLLSKDGLLLY